ncbi:Protein detoxification 31 [Vitis vinifera]|uniref:Protein detoxification 31 n=1 Tax=Vitis vinifera TaxID=29760 RepID=A0A438E706_VITVI|nr:Protein detoxification 31 [Vitis vinifera]
MENDEQPLLSTTHDQEQTQNPRPAKTGFFSFLAANYDDDMDPINGVGDFFREFRVESKKLWHIAGPAIFTYLCRYSLGAITQVFVGHIGALQLAAFAVENSVISMFSLGTMRPGDTLWASVWSRATGYARGVHAEIMDYPCYHSLTLSLIYIFAEQILKLIGETEEISKAAGVFALWMLPQLFSYALSFPISKFLQSQRKMLVLSLTAGVTLVLHAFFSWLLIMKLGWGLVGAAVFGSVVLHGINPLAGYLKNAEVSVDALSICMTILGWAVMLSIGFNAAVSVRVSNELGASHPRTAKFSVAVAAITSFLISVVLSLILIAARRQYPDLFSSNAEIKKLVYSLTPLLAVCIVINNIQPVLSERGKATTDHWRLVLIIIWWYIQASMAEERIRKWGGAETAKENHSEN